MKNVIVLLLFCLSISTHSQTPTFVFQNGHSGSINKLLFSNDDSRLASAGSDGKIIIWDVVTGKQIIELKGHSGKVNDFLYSKSGNLFISSDDDDKVYFWSLPEYELIEIVKLQSSVKSISLNKSETTLACGGDYVNYIDTKSYKVTRGSQFELNHHSYAGVSYDGVEKIHYDEKGKYLCVSSSKSRSLQLIDLASNKVFKLEANPKVSDFKFNKESTRLYIAGTKGNLIQYNLETNKSKTLYANRMWNTFNCLIIADETFIAGNSNGIIYKYAHNFKSELVFNAHIGEVNTIALTSDEKIMASGGLDNQIILWDYETGEIIKIINGKGSKINDLQFSDRGEEIIIAYDNGEFRHWNLKNNEIKFNTINPTKFEKIMGWRYSITKINQIENNNVQLAVRMVKTNLNNASKKERYKYFFLDWNIEKNTYKVSPDITKTQKKNTPTTNSKYHLRISNPKYNFDAAISKNGLIVFLKKNTEIKLLTLGSINQKDFFYVTPDNYYFISKNALKYVGFRLNNAIFSFEQFDIIYNRPDKVLEQLPFANQLLIENYAKAYNKRLAKLNITNLDFGNAPQLKLSRVDKLITSEKSIDIELEIKDSISELASLHILVNGVSIYGKSNKPISGDFLQLKETVSLSAGMNDIQIYATNKMGVSSIRSNFQINCKHKFGKPNLYIVSIGSSKFIQSDYNLTYAAKDAEDVVEMFSEINSYNNVNSLLLTNQEVTKNALVEAEVFLEKANTNDVIILFFAGHGVLDANLDYFLSSYDMDFNSPAEKGTPYSAIENLLDGVKARNKILFIDACHSGEVDKDEMELTNNTVSSEDDITFRAVGNNVENKNAIGLKSSFELSKELFADMRQSNGAIIISSAGAGEFAFEGEKWSNGVFTYALIRGLRDKKADLNGDNKIMVSELQKYLFAEVKNLTKGLQTPTSRVENLKNDFKLR